MTADDILFLMAAAVFAVTGVLAAARQNMDALSLVVIGVVTSIGGGTLRDVTLDAPVFWLEHPSMLYVSAGAALATFFFEQIFRATYRAFLYLDAAGTAVFTVMATEKTLKLGFSPGVAVVMGVMTGIGGGIIRDLLTDQPTILTRRELYMTPILFGGVAYVSGIHFGLMDPAHLAVVAMLIIALVRAGAIHWEWAFPDWLTYKPLK